MGKDFIVSASSWCGVPANPLSSAPSHQRNVYAQLGIQKSTPQFCAGMLYFPWPSDKHLRVQREAQGRSLYARSSRYDFKAGSKDRRERVEYLQGKVNECDAILEGLHDQRLNL